MRRVGPCGSPRGYDLRLIMVPYFWIDEAGKFIDLGQVCLSPQCRLRQH